MVELKKDLPEIFEEFADQRRNSFLAIKKLKEQGVPVVGAFCTYLPKELPRAMGAAVVGLCSVSDETIPDAEKDLPRNLCPLIKSSYGFAKTDKCPFFYFSDLVVGETTCDGKKKAYEILGEDVPMYIMDLPQMKRECDILKWKDEIAAFAKKVEEFTGNTITPEKLDEAIRLINNKRKALARVFEARKNPDNIPISGTDALLVTQIAFFDDPARCAEMCNKLADELEERNRQGVSVFEKGTKRIMITGTPMAIPNWKLHHIVETSGAAVVCEEMCTGTRYFENLVEEGLPTLDEQFMALSKRYMKNNCSCFTPNPGRVEDILRLAKEYHVDGVIDVNLKFCCLYDTEGYSVERALREAGIPVLGIETDYDDGDSEQLRTRIGAFVEMLG